MNYCFARVNAFLKVREKRSCMSGLVHRVVLMIIALFSTVCAFYITEEKVASTLLGHYIQKEGKTPTLKDICAHITYTDPLYSVDLKDYSFMLLTQMKHIKTEDWMILEKVLEKICVIRCHTLRLHNETLEKAIPYRIVKMLIDRAIVTNVLEIYGPVAGMLSGKDAYNPHSMGINKQNMLLNTSWEEVASMELILRSCSNETVEMILEHYSTRALEIIIFEDLNIKRLDLNRILMSNTLNIILRNLLEIESIVFPDISNMDCGVIDLYDMPQLREMPGAYKFLSTNRIEFQLDLDAHIFGLCGKAFAEEIASSQEKVLEVEKIILTDMPPTYKEIEKLFSSPWIVVKNILIQTALRSCYTSDEDVQALYTLDIISRMGICLLDVDGQNSYVTSLPYQIDIDTCEFLKRITTNSSAFNSMMIDCSRLFYADKNDNIECTAPPLYIHLRRSEEIQEAIEKFQEKYDILCVHIGYSEIIIDGLLAPENWAEVLVRLLSCMGHGITVDHLYFCNMKEPIEIDAQETLEECFKARKHKFILKKLYFTSCNVGFIQSILAKYSYDSKTRVYIDYNDIKEEEIWSLFRELANCQFSKVILRNASIIIEKLQEKGYSLECMERNALVLRIRSLQWFVNHIHITKCMFLKDFTLSAPYLSRLALENQTVSKENKEQKEIYHFLISGSIAETCAKLKEFSTTVRCIMYVDVLIHDSTLNLFATIDELSTFIGIVKRIFVDMVALCIFNLGIKKEEIEHLHRLDVHIDTEENCKLKCILLRKYNAFDATVTAISEKNVLQMPNYNIGSNYLKYWIKKKLLEKNVSIDRRVLPFILEKDGKNSSDANIDQWEKDLLGDEKCLICSDDYKSPEIYIMHQCKHCMCRVCAKNWYASANTCPFCRSIANFDKPFYFLHLNYSEEEPLTEDALLQSF
ncbi:hypothetical protein NEFER01_1261 [Nematocida sp. LUAm1]|nr:hypothetical protein NEFER01_1261 [Nematocida sp. LUAm1]